MRYGNELKVGLITLITAALVIAFAVYVRGLRAGARSYVLKVVFADARGLQQGDPVRMVGVKIGEVESVSISAARPWLGSQPRHGGPGREAAGRRSGPPGPSAVAVVTVKIAGEVAIPDHYAFRIGTSGLIQERFVEVVPAAYSPEAEPLKDGDEVQGELSPDLSDLMASGVEVLDGLNRTSQMLRSVLSDQEVLAGVKGALSSFTESAKAASDLAGSASELMAESRPELMATLKRLQEAAGELEDTTSALQTRLGTTTALDDFEKAAREASEAAAKANQMVTDLSEVADPETRRQLKQAIAAASEAAESLRIFAEELRKAAPVVPKVAKEAENIAEYSTGLRERLKPPEIHARFDVLYSGKAGRSFSSGLLDFKTSEGQFLRLGIDDVGEDSAANIQIGEQQRKGVLRYGLVRSRLGFGLDCPLPGHGTISLDVLDPNNVRADILADIPLILGRQDLGLTAGVRDLGEDTLFVAGLRMRR
jgi:phospholipid/cholesterol/gamma-HCH transport system substrate-binding protein